MRRARRIMVVIASAGLIWPAGSGRAGTAPKSDAKPAPKTSAPSWKTARPVIPEWASKKPSTEFLRAARVLRPMPPESMKGKEQTEAENAARVAGAKIRWLAAYEFFGSLSDKQIDRFLGSSPRCLEIEVGQLTRPQRAALDRYFAAWRTEAKGQATAHDPAFGDCVLMLYKMGAKRDLSNVLVGFDAGKYMGSGHYVHLFFRIARTDSLFGSGFAQI